MNTRKNIELAFIPCPGLSHLVPIIESAKLLLNCDPLVSITVLIMKLHTDPALEKYKQTLISSSRLRFVTLPATPDASTALRFEAIDEQAAHVRAAVSDLIIEKPGSRLAGLVLDVLTTNFVDIADEFGLPSYVFCVSSASALGLMFHLLSNSNDDLENEEKEQLSVPCFLSPVPRKALPDPFLNEGPEPATIIGFFKRIFEVKGVLINTFRELEPFAVESMMSSSLSVGPKVYPVGPVLCNNNTTAEVEVDGNKTWLDRQPEGSVVFLCFGTMGSFEAVQVREIATALEKSGKRFLWSLRKQEDKAAPTEYEDFSEVLPEGFLERTVGVGRVTGWADQVGVLAHRAVGGFVSHCGWNSVLESVWFGVPVATLPLYSEHQLNALLLVKELGMAEEIRIEYRMQYSKGGAPSEIIGAGDIEAAIRRLMEGDTGVRRKVKEMQRKSREVFKEGGSSYNAHKDFIQDVFKNIN